MTLLSALLMTSISLSAFAGPVMKIQNPVHEETRLPFSLKSDKDGVCRYFGFDNVLRGSVRKAVKKTQAIIVDEDSIVVEQEKTEVIELITCIAR